VIDAATLDKVGESSSERAKHGADAQADAPRVLRRAGHLTIVEPVNRLTLPEPPGILDGFDLRALIRPRSAADEMRQRIRQEHRRGHSWSEIGCRPEARAMPTPTGRGPWFPSSVRQVAKAGPT